MTKQKCIFAVCAVFFFLSGLASFAATNNEICKLTKSDFKTRIFDFNNRIAFANKGGLFNGGTCWWHSRFQLVANQLVFFKPELSPPTSTQAKRLIQKITQMNEVVIIPGFKNLYDFSRHYEDLIQKQFNAWQAIDGFILQKWITGLSGKPAVTAESLRTKMDALYSKVSNEELTFQVLQFPGVLSHAWIVIDMILTKTGYLISYVDSNDPLNVRTAEYQTGMTSLIYGNAHFVPYTAYSKDRIKMVNAIHRYCHSRGVVSALE